MKPLPPAPGHGRVTAVAAGAAVVVALAGSVTAIAYDQAGSAGVPGTLSFALAVAAIAVVGAVVTLAVPGNRVGWLLLAAAPVMGTGLAFMNAGAHGVITAPGSVPGASYLAALGIGRGRGRDAGRHARRASRLPRWSPAGAALALARLVHGRRHLLPAPR